MDILRRSSAPISDAAWGEIDSLASDYLKNALSARFLVGASSPKGWGHQVVSSGRLGEIKTKGSVSYGLYVVKPLLELRVPFELNVWELDNASRGAKDVDLDVLEKAAAEVAAFEDSVLYDGLKEAGIEGIAAAGESGAVDFPGEPEKMAQAVSTGVAHLMQNGIEGPYNLAVPLDVWQQMKGYVKGMPLEQHIEKILGGELIPARALKRPILVSARGGDFEMTLGQDLSIGYSAHTTKTVTLYFTESFTFEIFEPRAILVFK